MNIMLELAIEIGRAGLKFPDWPIDALHALAILGE